MLRSTGLALVLVSIAAGTLVAACGAKKGGSGFENPAKPRGPDGGALIEGEEGEEGTNPGPFGEVADAGVPANPACVKLQCKQVLCTGPTKTTVSGTIFDPAGRNPLYNVVVYVPNSTPDPITDGATCDKCGTLYTGSPVVSALTGPDGKFVLENVPVGDAIPLVIQIGKWRRQITIPSVKQCVDTPMTDVNLMRLPKNRAEGDLPKIAISTGGADSLECLLPRIGVDPAEFTSGDGPERIHVFQGEGGKATAAVTQKPQTALWNDKASLLKFDIVALSCEGAENGTTKSAAARQAMQDYTGAGGRVFASHFHYFWFSQGPAPFPQTASWLPQPGSGADLGIISGKIDQTFPKGIAFAQWLKNVNALQTNGTLAIVDAKHNADVDIGTHKGSQPWITNAGSPTATEYFTFNTPLTVPAEEQCGRVVFSDLHVGAASNDYKAGSLIVPTGCKSGDLTPQEKALEFMLFDLSSCLLPDSVPPTPPPPPPPPAR